MPEATSNPALESIARGSLLEMTTPESIGPVVETRDDGEGIVTLFFAADMVGYPGWRWTVSISNFDDQEPSVLETELTPGDGALLAPDWVPWSDRLADYKAAQEGEEATDDESESDDDDESDDEDDDSEDDDDELEESEEDDDDDLGSDILHGGDLDGVDIDEVDVAAAGSSDDDAEDESDADDETGDDPDDDESSEDADDDESDDEDADPDDEGEKTY